MLPFVYFLLPLNQSIQKPIETDEVIHIEPIKIPATPKVDTAQNTLENLRKAIASIDEKRNVFPEKEAEAILLSLREKIKPVQKPLSPPKKEPVAKKEKIVKKEKVVKKVVEIKEIVKQPIKPKIIQEKVKKVKAVKIETKKPNMQKVAIKEVELKEESSDFSHLNFVQTLGVVETKEYIITPQTEAQNEASYDDIPTAKFNQNHEGDESEEALQHLPFAKTLGVVSQGEL